MKIKEALKQAIDILKQANILTKELDAELLLEHVLKKHGFDRVKINSYPETEINARDENAFFSLINRRAQKEPVAYLTKHKEFFGLDFYVDKRVLIPRPETEILVKEALNIIKKKTYDNNKIKVLDVGTGSGCIAIALEKTIQTRFPNLLKQVKIEASDISDAALEVTKINLKKHHLEKKIRLHKSDLLKDIEGQYDLICANLPYLSKKDYSQVDQDVKLYEPKKSLKSGDEGVELYLKLFDQIPKHLQKDAELLIEIHPYQKEILVTEAKKKFSQKFKDYTLKDLAQKERVLLIQF